MNNFTRRLAISTVAAGTLLATAFTPGAFAAPGDTSATVSAGLLTMTSPEPADFVGKSITGVSQDTTAALAAFSVTDFTGSGAGWNVTAQATVFDGAIGANAIPANSLTMSQPSIAADGTLSPAPGLVGEDDYTIDTGTSAVKIAAAAIDDGMGKYDFGATTLTLNLPALVRADVYTSVVTLSIVSAP